MIDLRTWSPLKAGLFTGTLFAFLIWGTAGVSAADVSASLVARILFAFALGLLSQQVIDGAYIQRGPRTWRNPHRWMYAYAMGAPFTAAMILVNWDGTENGFRVFVTWLITGVIFGIIMAFLPEKPDAERFEKRAYYKTDAPIIETSAFLRGLYFA